MAFTKCLLLVTALAVVALNVQAKPVQPEEFNFDEIARQFQEQAQRQFEEFKKQAKSGVPQLPQIDVKNLPTNPNGQVYGESQSSYHVESNINGKKTEESGGHRIINDNGKVTEYDTA